MYRLSYFRCDVTPPLGHPLLAGWSLPALEIVDRQWAHGIILTGAGTPILLLTMDWCEIRNSGYAQFKSALAAAISTTPERVFVHTVHQHDAVFADPDMERLLAEQGLEGFSLDLDFFERTIESVAASARAALKELRPITHISTGQARVENVASNRRVMRDESGHVLTMRGSSCQDEALRALPEGLIDPFLKTIGFWQDDTLLAATHYYATHPMSYYRQGGVSRDFCGLARDQLAKETGVPQLYFTGAAGNIAAGKYNDGTPAMRAVLVERMLEGMRQSLGSSVREALETLDWQTAPLPLTARQDQGEDFYRAWLENPAEAPVQRCYGALGLATLERMKSHPDALDMSCLSLNNVRVLQLPGEPFLEYQLYAQHIAPHHFVAMAGYGDSSPGYLPTASAYEEGGYESSWVAFTAPATETVLKQAIEQALCPTQTRTVL